MGVVRVIVRRIFGTYVNTHMTGYLYFINSRARVITDQELS